MRTDPVMRKMIKMRPQMTAKIWQHRVFAAKHSLVFSPILKVAKKTNG